MLSVKLPPLMALKENINLQMVSDQLTNKRTVLSKHRKLGYPGEGFLSSLNWISLQLLLISISNRRTFEWYNSRLHLLICHPPLKHRFLIRKPLTT